MDLIRLNSVYFMNDASKIGLGKNRSFPGKARFLAIGLEKSRTAQNWEDLDYFNIIILTKSQDEQCYLAKIEHPAYILSPQNAEDDMRVSWVRDDSKLTENVLIRDLYALDDSRSRYTITIQDIPYLFIEKYICYTMTVSYEIWENYDKSKIEVSPYLKVRCQFSAHHPASRLEDTPSQTLEYPIDINSLMQTSVFNCIPFEIWNGKVVVDGIKVTLALK